MNATISELIERYIVDVDPVKKIGTTHMYALRALQRAPIGAKQAAKLKAQDVIEHCRTRRAAGAGPATVGQDLVYLRGPLAYAAVGWGLGGISIAPLIEAKPILDKYQLVGKSRPRDRRPTEDEYERLLELFKDQDARSKIKMAPLLEFAVLSCRRISEITRLRWTDVDAEKRTCIVRDTKDPRHRIGNHHTFALLGRAWDIVQAQPRTSDRIFPYHAKSAGARYTRAKKLLGIENLRFHDNRREAASRLFEQGYGVPEVMVQTGHKTPAMLMRVYTKLKPEDLHKGPAAKSRT